ncbi:MAG: Do family serine endopeptidase [Candidatus Cloacimonetes bacterium]|nr:Do family serine endopeptidase [Candidatus Cloacimonadota bacterium]
MKQRIIILMALMLFAAGLLAQYPVNQDYQSPFVQVVKNTRASVVNIQVEYEVGAGRFGDQTPLNDDFFRFFFPEIPRGSQPRSHTSMAMGSGFIFKQDGRNVYILTNNHVVEKGEKGEITVTLADKAKHKATIVGLDEQTDLAVIKIEVDKNEKVVVVPLGDSDAIEIADWVIAIGNPFGQLGLDRTVTVGVVSAKGRANLRFGGSSPVYQDYIQTDAAINPGNSGGPLLNIHGEVVGVNAAITSTSGGNVGIGFAVPVNLAKKVADDILREGKVVRAYIGIIPQEIDADLRQSLNLDTISGVLVAKVEKDTPADKAGLKRGDVIVSFDGKDVPNVAKFRIGVANSEIGVKTPVAIIRDGKRKNLQVKLSRRPDEADAVDEPAKEVATSLGLSVENLDGEFARRYNIQESEGVVITRVQPQSAAAKAGLQAGDVILEMNNKPIGNEKQYRTAVKEAKGDIVLLYIKSYRGSYKYVTLELK